MPFIKRKMEYHTLEPYYNKNSKILILGSFPSRKSREEGFYYAHPKNRFWPVLASVFNCPLPITIDDKKEFLNKNKIALYDVCASCEIKASSDASIKKVIANDLAPILEKTEIKTIFVNGNTAYKYYNKLIRDKIGVEAILLPSTSPANAKFKLEDLVSVYQVLNKY